MLHLPAHWHWRARWKALWHNVIGYPIAQPAPPNPTFQALSAPPSQARPKEPKGKLVQASGSPTPHRATLGRIPKQPRRRQHEITHPRIQA
ncbi:hypothetical protein I553_5656 [Mycobacterium xenopi 4042]|uniref:Uncharacterized protein n=1 Tax=Mycobacterium xenopi 4042 TaxID=1299334 RepID=X7ZVC9_MYCXE|nr:hypothetical protein I553_5656 [Mycobacterium xenopi 4042]